MKKYLLPLAFFAAVSFAFGGDDKKCTDAAACTEKDKPACCEKCDKPCCKDKKAGDKAGQDCAKGESEKKA